MAVQNTPSEGDVNVVQFRIERGAEAMATDGRIGIVEQIVVDRASGQLLSLVIRGDETNTEFEMPAGHVLRATGDHVYLNVSRGELMNHPEMTKPYDPEQYVPVYQGDAVPTDIASQVAAEQEKPVITDVEENAAELVAPETTTAQSTQASRRTDERVATPPVTAAAAPATDTTTWTPREGAVADEDVAPTVKLNRAGATGQAPTDWGEAVGTEERPVPTPEPSATPETTGPLMGGKPSTGGMGTASTVPTSTAPALDTVPTSPNLPPYTTEHAMDTQAPSIETTVPAAETHPPSMETTTPEALPVTQAAVTPEETTGIPMELEQPEVTGLLPEPSPQLMTTPSRQLANLRDHLPDLLLNMAKSPEVWILAGSLGVGIIGGIVARQRRVSLNTAPTARQAKRTAGNVLDRAQDRIQAAQSRVADKTGDIADKTTDTLKSATKSATRNTGRTRQQAKKTAKRAARRGRWFRRGLLVGGTGAMLFAPRPGEETRTQLKSTWEQLRSRIA